MRCPRGRKTVARLTHNKLSISRTKIHSTVYPLPFPEIQSPRKAHPNSLLILLAHKSIRLNPFAAFLSPPPFLILSKVSPVKVALPQRVSKANYPPAAKTGIRPAIPFFFPSRKTVLFPSPTYLQSLLSTLRIRVSAFPLDLYTMAPSSTICKYSPSLRRAVP